MLFSVPVGAFLFAAMSILAATPFRRPRGLAVVTWLVTAAPSELPLVFVLIVVASSVPDAVEGDTLALALALVSATALAVVAARGLRARRALRGALDEGLGRPWQWQRDGRPNWWRSVVAPWPFRPRDVDRVSDVSYGADGVDNLLDVYRHRSQPAGAPTLVYFHGGHFRWGRKSREARPLLYRLARQGWTCISANYHRSPTPGDGFPRHLVDVKRVIAWARSDGARFGIDCDAIVVAGSSAGAHLAAMAALTAGDLRFQPGFESADTSVDAAICLYGYYGRLGGSQDQISSPIDHVHGDAPPFFIVHGTNDTYTPIEGARSMAAALRRTSHETVVLAELPGAQHSFDVFHSVRFEAVVDAVGAFTASVGIGSEHPPATRHSPKPLTSRLTPLLLVLAAACGNDSDDDIGTTPTSAPSTTTSTTSAPSETTTSVLPDDGDPAGVASAVAAAWAAGDDAGVRAGADDDSAEILVALEPGPGPWVHGGCEGAAGSTYCDFDAPSGTLTLRVAHPGPTGASAPKVTDLTLTAAREAVALWPFTTAQEAENTQQSVDDGHSPWHLEDEAVALSFAALSSATRIRRSTPLPARARPSASEAPVVDRSTSRSPSPPAADPAASGPSPPSSPSGDARAPAARANQGDTRAQ
jgi:acetyl esterase/lipase